MLFQCLYFLELPDFGRMITKRAEGIEGTILIISCGS